ncbi:MAG: NAD(P)-binding domain-containing protein [Euryarchaeota archaeon]|nr:NAD(P)-binding domain-containing protein [Euryarchaeota archaeon]
MAKGKIAIIGDGNVGTNLKKGLERTGYEVRSVGKEPDKVRELAKWGECIILAVPPNEIDSAVKEMGDGFKGKVVIDPSNIVDASYDFAGDVDRSGAEKLQAQLRDAQVVKAFNTVFAENMSDGKASGETLTLFYAGNDDKAKKQVREMGEALGFDPVDAGPLSNARWLETLGFLNITLGYKQEMGTDIGFRLVHPDAKTERPTEMAASQRA